MTARQHAVSVVIPCYNSRAFLRETLDSVLAQTVRPMEVIVVDDGSTDGSAEIAAAYGEPVRVIRQENQGESVARNRGIDEACGDWIAFIDADDVWRPTKLERQLEAIEPGVDCLHTNSYYFGMSEGEIDVSDVPPEIRYSLEYVAVANPFRVSDLMVHRTIPVRFPEWTQYAEDLIYYLDLCLVAKGIRLVKEPLAGCRVHAKSQSTRPDVAIRRYETIQRWMEQRKANLDCATRARIRNGVLAQMVEVAMLAKYQRDWRRYWTLRHFLEGHPDCAAAQPLLHERIYPRWVYSLKDKFDWLYRGHK